jgi:hypothetical protein
MTTPTTPPIATELTGPLVKPKPKTSSEKLQILLNKTKSRSAPSSPGTAAAKERLDEYSSLSGEAKTIGLTEKEEKKLQEHLKTQYVELTNDDINYFRANYKLTGYLPGVGTFGRTAADREKKRKEFEKTSLEMFKSMKAAEAVAVFQSLYAIFSRSLSFSSLLLHQAINRRPILARRQCRKAAPMVLPCRYSSRFGSLGTVSSISCDKALKSFTLAFDSHPGVPCACARSTTACSFWSCSITHS